MTKIDRRLDRLEHRQRAQLGIRVFERGPEDPGFYEHTAQPGVAPWQWQPTGEPYTEAQIHALQAQGWQCILIEHRAWQPPAQPG